MVWRLDRLGRSLKDLIARAEELRSSGVGLKSLKEAIDTDSPTGQLVFHIFGALAEFERAVIRERTQRACKRREHVDDWVDAGNGSLPSNGRTRCSSTGHESTR